MFPPINQWGHLPAPIYPLSRHAVSILARQIHTGLPAHRDLNVDDVVEVLNPAEPRAVSSGCSAAGLGLGGGEPEEEGTRSPTWRR